MPDRDRSREFAVGQLHDALRRGIDQLNAEGITNEAIANRVHVERSTVDRWYRGRTVITRENAAALASVHPERFPDVVLLRGDVERLERIDRHQPVVRVAESIAETYRDVVDVLEGEATQSGRRLIRHCAFHGERSRHRRDEEDLPDDLAEILPRFDGAMTACIVKGCHAQTIFTVASRERLEGRIWSVASLNAPALEVRAYPSSPVPLLAPLIVGDVAFIATDHQRWHRAEAAIRVEGNRSVLAWLHRYFETLWDQAPYRLRDQAGANEGEFERLRLALG